MKKILVAVVIVLLIFIPTYIAIGSYIATQNDPISTSFVDKIDIADLDGKTVSVSKTNTAGDLVSFFADMNKNSTKVNELPEPLVGSPFYKVTFYSGKVSEDYKYYFDITGALSYAEYPDGSHYQLSQSDVSKFLVTPYALSLFPDEKLPILKTPTGDEISPAKVDWRYKLDGKEYSKLSGFVTTDSMITYTMEGSVMLNFTSDADLYTIKVYDKDSNPVYDGSTEDLSTLIIDGDGEMTFMVTASWYQDGTRDFFGEATYNFKASLVAGAEFFVGKESGSVQPGDFVAISGYNISDPSKIRFESVPSIGFTPKFYKDGDHVLGFVPINAELSPGSYVFTLSYGAAKQEINLTVAKKNFKRRNQTISKIVAENTRSEEAMKEFDELFASLCAVSEETRYFGDSFTDYEASKAIKTSITSGFGQYRTITSTKEEYRNLGVEWKAAAGAEIPACAAGKVVYSGITTHGGRMVVIDHGMGLKTWFMRLGEAKVEAGDTVAQGDIIGTAGKTGFTETNGFYTIMTVGNVPVCPYRSWDTGVGMDIYTK